MPEAPASRTLSLTSSSLNGLMMASIFFMGLSNRGFVPCVFGSVLKTSAVLRGSGGRVDGGGHRDLVTVAKIQPYGARALDKGTDETLQRRSLCRGPLPKQGHLRIAPRRR